MRGRELECLDLSEEEIKRLEEKKDSGYGGSQGLIRLAPKVVFHCKTLIKNIMEELGNQCTVVFSYFVL